MTAERNDDLRVVRDSMGELRIPADRRWGAQTERAVHNFNIGDERVPLPVVHAIATIKRAAARVHRELGTMDVELADAIERAAARVAAGELDEHFPLVVWQSGSGTQTHMNVNEVIAHEASELLGGASVHPNDDVNRAQSTNDVFPTATSIALVLVTERRVLPALDGLHNAVARHAAEWSDLWKIGRTHLMDATPLTLGDEVSAWARQVDAARAGICAALASLRELAIGGTAVGTGINTPPEWTPRMVHELGELTGCRLTPPANPFAAIAGAEAIVGYSGALRGLACALMKIANDVRWLASGPRCGLGELELPANEPGSSIMPGKVNPTQAEALCMVCARVIGNDATIALAGASGNLQLNTYRPLLAYAALQSASLLGDAMTSFANRCIAGLHPNRKQLRSNMEQSLMLVTALAPQLGYDRAAMVAKAARERDLPLREVVVELGVMNEREFDAAIDRALRRHP